MGVPKGSCYPWSWSVNAGGRKSNWVRGFSTFKGKVQVIREDIDSFEKSVVKALADIQCVLKVIRPYDLAQEGIVAPYKVLLLFRCEFQQGEEVSCKVKEALLQHRNRWEKLSTLHHLSEGLWYKNNVFHIWFHDIYKEEVYRLLFSRIASDGCQIKPFCRAEQALHDHTLLAAAAPNPPL